MAKIEKTNDKNIRQRMNKKKENERKLYKKKTKVKV